jgi:hypothetical protein
MCKFQSANKLLSSSWDGKAHTYAIVESPKPAGQVTGLDLYIFVVRRRVGQYINATLSFLADYESPDKKTKVTTCYVDVKSELLRDILNNILNDIKGISLNESKLSVSYAPVVLRPATYSKQGRAELALHHPSRARVVQKLE